MTITSRHSYSTIETPPPSEDNDEQRQDGSPEEALDDRPRWSEASYRRFRSRMYGFDYDAPLPETMIFNLDPEKVRSMPAPLNAVLDPNPRRSLSALSPRGPVFPTAFFQNDALDIDPDASKLLREVLPKNGMLYKDGPLVHSVLGGSWRDKDVANVLRSEVQPFDTEHVEPLLVDLFEVATGIVEKAPSRLSTTRRFIGFLRQQKEWTGVAMSLRRFEQFFYMLVNARAAHKENPRFGGREGELVKRVDAFFAVVKRKKRCSWSEVDDGEMFVYEDSDVGSESGTKSLNIGDS